MRNDAMRQVESEHRATFTVKTNMKPVIAFAVVTVATLALAVDKLTDAKKVSVNGIDIFLRGVA